MPISKKIIKLPKDQWQAYSRLPSLLYLSAANMERSEPVLKSLVSKKLAIMTRAGKILQFKRAVHNFSVSELSSEAFVDKADKVEDAYTAKALATKTKKRNSK